MIKYISWLCSHFHPQFHPPEFCCSVKKKQKNKTHKKQTPQPPLPTTTITTTGKVLDLTNAVAKVNYYVDFITWAFNGPSNKLHLSQ